jgi:putative salt-induced outer membrane protein YdiY
MTRFNSFIAVGALALAAILAPGAHAQAPTIQTNAPWVSSASVGLTLTRGNSKTLLFAADIKTERKGPKNEIALGADGTYGETTDQETDDTDRSAGSAHAFAQYNYLFTERFYGYARLDGVHDAVANIHYRLSFSPGAGYYFIKNPKTYLAGEVGPGFVTERTHDDSRGYDALGNDLDRDDDQEYMTIRFADRFEHKFSNTVRVWQTAEFLPQIDYWRNYIINCEVGLEAALSKKLALRTYVQETYDNEPAPGRKKNDLKWVTALAYKF